MWQQGISAFFPKTNTGPGRGDTGDVDSSSSSLRCVNITNCAMRAPPPNPAELRLLLDAALVRVPLTSATGKALNTLHRNCGKQPHYPDDIVWKLAGHKNRQCSTLPGA